mgnify:CR=1 FL=1
MGAYNNVEGIFQFIKQVIADHWCRFSSASPPSLQYMDGEGHGVDAKGHGGGRRIVPDISAIVRFFLGA